MIQNDILTERQRRCIPDVTFELIPIKNLVSNQDYQRPLSEGHIRKALEEFDVFQINPVKVSRRNGINYVFDGQHTIEIVASESGSRDTPVWCMVYTELQYQEEAHIFADQQKHVKALVPYEMFNAHIEAGDEKQKMIEAIVRSYGLTITSTRQMNGICAVTTLERIYDKFGHSVLDTTLRLEELQNIIRDTRVSSAIYSTGDPFRDLLSEIYFEGYVDGYNHLKDIIERQEPRIFGCGSSKFFAKNMDKIRRRAGAILESEGGDNE